MLAECVFADIFGRYPIIGCLQREAMYQQNQNRLKEAEDD
jgi:hypothetical protein